jgi:hypothetical protein
VQTTSGLDAHASSTTKVSCHQGDARRSVATVQPLAPSPLANDREETPVVPRSGRRELLQQKVRDFLNRVGLETQIANRRRYAI